jgi:glycosyltransferase involved in cell wall biosynthesis
VNRDRSLLLVSPYLPPHVGGVEQYVLQLARRLSGELGWRVVIAATGERSRRRTPVRELDGDLTIYRLPVLLEKWSLGFGDAWPATLRTIIRTESIDVVNAHAPVPFIADAAARAVRRTTPFVLTYHAGPMRKGRLAPDALGWGYEHLLLPRTAARASQVIVSSMFVARELGHALGRECVAIPPGVDEIAFAPSGGDAPTSTLLYVGSLSSTTPYKNVPLLLQAVRTLVDRYPRISLAIVGDGDMATAYAERADELGIADRVTFRGRLAGRELVDAYRQATILTLPTLFDSAPTVLVEAMACGIPIVSTTVGGIPELVESGVEGLLVPPADLAAFTGALDSLLDNPARARAMGAAGRARVERSQNWPALARRTSEILESVRATDVSGPRVRLRP